MPCSRTGLFLLILSLCFSPSVSACNIPVFRYALERWRNTQEDDRYHAVLFHRGPWTAEDKKIVSALRGAAEGQPAAANLSVETVDLAGEVDASLLELWEKQKNASLPWLVVRSPIVKVEPETVWSGALQTEAVKVLLDSPMRREIAQRLMKGDAVVWLLLESGDKERDDRAAELLQTQLRRLEKSVRLPDAAADDSVQLLSRLPLQLVFSTLRVQRTDPAEKMLVAMLLHTDSELVQSSEPMVFPIFGRGRVLDALIGKGINADTLQDAARFLCGACSCLVKRLNPGVDLLIAADWDAILEDRKPVPPSATIRKRERVPIPSPKQPSEAGEQEETLSSVHKEETTRLDSSHTHMLTVAAVVSLLAFGAGILAWRARTRKRNEEET